MRLEGLVSKIQGYLPGAELDLIRRAYEFSAEKHKSQRRASGEPYVSHPLAVASIIGDLRLDVPSVVTGLLHDTVEDTLTSLGQVEALFGSEIATLVDGVTKISQINFRTREEHRAENIRKMIIAMSEDLRVILIKLADRTHNMRTLGGLPPDKQAKVAQETLDIFAPLAHRLGIYWMKSEMEDNALHALHPEVFYQLKRAVSKKKTEREKYIREVQAVLERQFEAAGMECFVHGRPKHFYSIYQKMRSQNLLYEQVYDLVAFRVVVDTARECYEALGVVHGQWKPVPGRFKDYIALPKGNGYQSLHTTVIGPRGERIEVQIRSSEMHRFAEQGIAAHWTHKEGGGIDQEEIQRFQWLRQMLEWQQHVRDPNEFLHSFKEDLVPDEVYVFTPKGDLLHFPAGATIIDFAYRIHSEVGHRCTGARVAGRLVPLRYKLQNGDTIEIITTQHQQPSRDWLKMVRTPRAKERIREWIKAEESTRSVEVGREILARDLAHFNLDLVKLSSDGTLDRVAHELGVEDFASLVTDVGYGKITPRQVIERLVPAEELEKPEVREGPLARLFRVVARRPAASGIKVSGLDDVLVRVARCCDPLPGEPITGLSSHGRGVTVHSAECATALEADPQRRVQCVWDGKPDSLRPIRLEVLCIDQPGLLAAISKAIAQTGVNIRNADARGIEDGKALNTFEVMVLGIADLNKVIRNLSRVKGVMRVDRVRG
ncbi:MAG: bifunctional (p)ppGpp synthetase/guanosine-3',5'-bis(diphosphate) 3'-pyrophosphohydrolase [Candidatus Binatia bacterium]|nr:bifunctional (p)ppGpp synthetase/guanosine-3',5'-bis(diphosphate) 3'-pyrophosphohydrolase [Candidatus Binatia bacterium]